MGQQIICNPTDKYPTHDVTLYDGSTRIGMVVVDSNGDSNISALRRFPLTRTGVKTSQGSTKYSDLEEPYMAIPQDDWTGGRGSEDLDDDATKYNDSSGIDPSSEFGMILGGLPHWTVGYRSMDVVMPGDVIFDALYDTSRYRARAFTASATYSAYSISVIIKKIGSPSALRVAIYTNNGGVPGSLIGDVGTLLAANFTDTLSQVVNIQLATPASLSNGNSYHVVIYGGASDDIDNHWEVGSDPDGTGDKSTDGSAWVNAFSSLYFGSFVNDGGFITRFFSYKGAFYFAKMYDSGANTDIYINGYRGAADSNAGNLDKLIDGVASWSTNEFAGCIVKIISGPGVNESQNWRTIVSNTATQLVVDSNWEATQNTNTEYVIIGDDKWRLWSTLSAGPITDLSVAGDFVYFALGDDVNVVRYRESNSGGWAIDVLNDVVRATSLLGLRDSGGALTLWGARNKHPDYGKCLFKALVPEAPGDLYTEIGTLAPTDQPWDAWVVGNVVSSISEGASVFTIAGGFTTGVAAVENLDQPVNITRGNKLGVLIKSTVTTNSGDLKLVIEDVADLGQFITALSVKTRDNAGTYATKTKSFDTFDDSNESYTLTTTDRLIIFSAQKFSQIKFNFGGTVNAVVSALTVKLFNGYEWTAVTITDGTATGGKTFAQNGDVVFTPIQDWTQITLDGVTGYAAVLTVSVNLTASVQIDEISTARKNNIYFSLPALTANAWTWATMTMAPTEEPAPDETAIRSVGLYVNVDNGAQVITMRGGVMVLRESVEWFKMPDDARITNIVSYSSGDDEIKNPWVFTENILYEVQTQNDNAIVPIPLDEVSALSSDSNGKASAQNDVYLYFNLGANLERYFNRNLDDVGPNRGSGLPGERQGQPSALASYPGRLICAVNAGNTGTSSVLVFSNNNWHEIYRAPYTGRIRDIAIQSLSDDSQRLWINWGRHVVWIPLSLNPYVDPDYEYIWEGHLISAWLYGGMQDVVKMWNNLKMFLENVSTSNYYIRADYQVDDDTAWTPISGSFDTTPLEELDFSTAVPPTVTGRRLRYRLVLITNDRTKTPRVKAVVIEAAGGVPVKYGYVWTFELSDGDMATDLEGVEDTVFTSVQAFGAKVDEWARNATPLHMRSISALFDDVIVKLDPIGLQPSIIDLPLDAGQGREKSFAQVSVNEL